MGKIFILLTWQKTYLNLFTEFEKQKVEINSTRKFVFDVIVSILKKNTKNVRLTYKCMSFIDLRVPWPTRMYLEQREWCHQQDCLPLNSFSADLKATKKKSKESNSSKTVSTRILSNWVWSAEQEGVSTFSSMETLGSESTGPHGLDIPSISSKARLMLLEASMPNTQGL